MRSDSRMAVVQATNGIQMHRERERERRKRSKIDRGIYMLNGRQVIIPCSIVCTRVAFDMLCAVLAGDESNCWCVWCGVDAKLHNYFDYIALSSAHNAVHIEFIHTISRRSHHFYAPVIDRLMHTVRKIFGSMVEKDYIVFGCCLPSLLPSMPGSLRFFFLSFFIVFNHPRPVDVQRKITVTFLFMYLFW